jgi:geranylgeranyl diphosphate synthase type II
MHEGHTKNPMHDDLRIRFASSLPLPPQLEPHLREALLHVLDTPGSLARPRLLLQMARVFGIPSERAENLAVAVEYFHTASLLIDDLPCMDDASERRSMPCLHVRFGEATTILAALALVNRAYMLAWRSAADMPAANQLQALAYLEARLGVEGLLHGQSLDLRYNLKQLSRAEAVRTAQRIAMGKTVSLIRLALVLPAILGGAPEPELRELERLAAFWGLSYQMIDDLKDVFHEIPGGPLRVAFGKTLGRPNAVLASGFASAMERLARMLRLSERPLDRMLRRRPELEFLTAVRSTLRSETATLRTMAQSLSLQEIA